MTLDPDPFAARDVDTITEECGWCGMWPTRLDRDTLLCRRCRHLPGARDALVAALELERITPAADPPSWVPPITPSQAEANARRLLAALATPAPERSAA